MAEPFIGSEAVASGVLVKSALRTQYTKLFRDVYVNPDTELTPHLRAHAGWLWCGGHASASLVGLRHASVTQGGKPLGRHQLHTGEHDGVLAGWRDNAGQQPAVFLPDVGLQCLARIRHAGETCAVGRDGGDVGVE
jgi:hypothetical protein